MTTGQSTAQGSATPTPVMALDVGRGQWLIGLHDWRGPR